MSKRCINNLALVCVVCLLVTIFSGFVLAENEKDNDLIALGYTDIPLYIDGILIGQGLMIDATTYVPFRAFCEAMDKNVVVAWDSNSMTATASMEKIKISVTLGEKVMTANDRCFYLPGGVKKISGVVMVPIRETAKAFGIDVNWNSSNWSVSIDSSAVVPLMTGGLFYNEEDLYWLSRIIYAESGNQPFEGMLGVGNVVLNRVKDPTCPDTVKDVIFDNRYGTQFHPTSSTIIHQEPPAHAVVAAKACLEGYNTVGNSLFFINPEFTESASWFRETRTFIAAYGDHEFFA